MAGKWLRRVRNVAVVGTYRAGKTVLLTSWLDHLHYHDPDTFRLGSDGTAEIRKFELSPIAKGPHAAPFPYQRFRDALVHDGSWPEKTCAGTRIRATFERTDHGWHGYELDLLDFPGERIADVAFAAMPNHAEWSDHVLEYVRSQRDYRELATPYEEALAALSAPATTGGSGGGGGDAVGRALSSLAAAWRQTLAGFILAFKPLVTPSVFLLDAGGSMASGATPAAVAEGRPLGADADHPVVPLPGAVREAHPELAACLETHYSRYRAEVALPLFEELARTDVLVVLVDVTTLLAGGTGMYNDQLAILEDLFKVVRGRGPLGNAWRDTLNFFGARLGRLRRVAFVATKIDLVAPQDRGRVRDLLREMTRHVARDLDVAAGWFDVAAIVSTRMPPAAKPDGARELVGRLVYDPATGERRAPTDEPQAYALSEVPEHWPARWNAETFHFPSVFPDWPANRQQPPRQIGLDKLTDFVLG